MGQLPELMTTQEVAKAFRVEDETIHRWTRKGRLDVALVVLPSGLKRFRRRDIEAIVAKLHGSAAEEPIESVA